MRLLLDTHIVLWWLADDPKLPAAAREAIADPVHEVAVSAASVWEIGIKQAVGRLDAPDDLVVELGAAGFGSLPMTAEHAAAAARLPAHHADPFDRMLIAQATIERLKVVTVDRRFAAYGVDLLPLGSG